MMIKKYGSASNGGRPESRAKIEATCIERYGVSNPMSRPEFKEMSKTTCIEKYGDDYLKKNAKKAAETCLDRYGVTVPFKSEQFKQKSQKTCIERYGVPYSSQNANVQQKAKETRIERYGSDDCFHTEEGLKKGRETRIAKHGSLEKAQQVRQSHIDATKEKRYGSRTYNNSEKRMQTNIERYGGPTALFSKEIRDKARRKYTYQGMPFDSSWEIAYWIWCIDNGHKIERNNQKYPISDTQYCFPDFIVDGQIVEIKGDNLMKCSDWPLKEACYNRHNIRVLMSADIAPIMEYIEDKYGKQYLKSFRRVRANYNESL
jgi:ribosomal protein S30